MPRPDPLPPSALLQARFQIEQALGQGEFGITYFALDLTRGDHCIVRELAPADSARESVTPGNGATRYSSQSSEISGRPTP